MDNKKRTRGWKNFSLVNRIPDQIRCRHCKTDIELYNKHNRGCCSSKCLSAAGPEVITNINNVKPKKVYGQSKKHEYNSFPNTAFDAVHERKYRGN